MWNVRTTFLRILLLTISVIVSACNPLASKNSVDANFNPGLGTSTNATIAIVPLISFTAPLNGSFVNAATDSAVFPILGNCDQAGEIVTVKLDGSTIASPVCNGVTFNATMNTTGLAISAHTLTASITNAVGTSTASSSFSRDLTAPAAAATALGWAQTSPWNSPTASWTLSVAGDIGNQKIQYYTGGACGAASGGLVDVGSATATTSVFSSGVDATTYTFKVITYDAAGNGITSACSSAMVIDKTVPSVSVTSLNSGAAYAGGSSQTITYTATDTNLGATPITLKYSLDNGANYTNIVANVANAGTYSWTLPAANSTQVRVQVYVVDQAGNIGTATTSPAFTIDSVAPTLTASSMSLNGGAGTTANNYLTVNLQSSDNLTNITHFCLKYNDTVAPISTAPCWIAVNAPSPGLTPSTSLNLSNYNYGVGFAPGAYSVYAWVRDAAGNISPLSNAGAGTLAKDKAIISYAPSAPPVVTDVLVSSSDAPSNPQNSTDLTIASGQTVFIKWKATDDNAIPAGAVSLYYTTDDSNYTLITSGLDNAQNGGTCSVNNAGTVADDNDTGCYAWVNASPTSSYFRVRVGVTDSNSQITFSSSTALNVSSNLSFVAGNVDAGINSAASSAVFNVEPSGSYGDTGAFVIAANGVIYVRDVLRGLMMINPSDGVYKLIVPTTGTSSGDGGSIASATLREPLKIALDYQDRVLILDYNRIRRINTAVSPMTIETIIGGGGSAPTPAGVAALSVAMTYTGTYGDQNTRAQIFTPLPNGDIYYSDQAYSTSPSGGWVLKVYRAASGLVQTITPSGIGYGGFPAADVSGCWVAGTSVGFDSSTGQPNKLLIASYTSGSAVNCVNVFSNASLDLVSGVANAPAPPSTNTTHEYNFVRTTGRNGQIYALSRFSAIVRRYDVGTNAWVTILGNNVTGTCPDGTAATSCSCDPSDVFVNAQGVLFFIERGKMRMIDSSGNVQSILGQGYSFGDGGHALSARFNQINNIGMTNSGEIIIFDNNEARFRAVATNGNISTIAGNGISNWPNTTTSAAGHAVASYKGYGNSDDFAVDPVTGDIFYNRQTRVAKLNRATDRWVDLVGNGATAFMAADGMAGSSIANFAVDVPRVIGFDGTNLLAALYGAGYNDHAFKLYHKTTTVQSHLAGVAGAYTGYCANGTNTATCSVNSYANQVRATYDAYNTPPQWAILQPSTNAVRGLRVGSTMQTIATLATNASSFVYHHDAANDVIYYCSISDFKIHKKDITGATDVALSWPISALKCTGRSMVLDHKNSRLLFPYTLNGLTGVAAYVFAAPPTTVAGLKAWYKADSITGLADGAAVSSWDDSSGNGYSAIQGTPVQRPVYKTNIVSGAPVVRFDGTQSQYLDIGTVLGKPTDFTVFAVFKTTDGANRQSIFASVKPDADGYNSWGTIAVSEVSPGTLSGANVSNGSTTGSWPRTTGSPISTGTFYYVSTQYVNGNAVSDVKLNGATPAQGTSGTPGVTNSGTAYPSAIGRHGGYNGLYFTGDVAEILVYNQTVSSGDRAKIEQYLRAKYGL